MSTFDKEWLENEAWYAGFTEGKDSLAEDLRLMFFDLDEALREEMEVHDEPSRHLVQSVGSWALRLHNLGLLSEDDKTHYLDMTGMEDDDE